jgi:hypothetical protein
MGGWQIHQDMAPRLLTYVSKHRINKRTVSEALEMTLG